ncbi:MAG: hypothetical protein QOG80_1271 [Pseudonocardiales bacterium]|jgi:hypothetical protein|nr:hypothetical protein [Pseudonocardiales bacterium]
MFTETCTGTGCFDGAGADDEPEDEDEDDGAVPPVVLLWLATGVPLLVPELQALTTSAQMADRATIAPNRRGREGAELGFVIRPT